MEWVVDTGADGRREVEPDSGGQKRCDHQPDEGVTTGHKVGIDDALLDRTDDIASCYQRASSLEERGDKNRAGQRDRPGADGGTDIVRDVIGADVHRHVTADHGGDHQHDSVDTAVGPHDGEEHDAHDEDQRRAESEEFSPVQKNSGFDPVRPEHRLNPSCVPADKCHAYPETHR